MKELTYNQRKEIFAGIKCGFQQYLRNVHGWTYQKIADYFHITQRTVWNHCNGDYTIKMYENRTEEEIKKYEQLYNKYIL